MTPGQMLRRLLNEHFFPSDDDSPEWSWLEGISLGDRDPELADELKRQGFWTKRKPQ